MKQWKIVIYLTVFLWWMIPGRTYGAIPEDSLGPLIASMTYQDEYEGLVHLGFLDTQTIETQNIKSAYQKVSPSVVGIYAENFVGSGVIYALEDQRIIVLSCRHLLQYDETPEITFIDGEKVQGKLFYLSEQADLGFVEVDPGLLSIDTIKKIRRIAIDEMAYRQIEEGTELFHVGSVGRIAGNMYEGVILNQWKFFPEFNQFMIHSKCKAVPGMSGGGTFDAKGNYIGMILGGKGTETASLPLETIMEEWNIMIQQEDENKE